MAHSEKGSPHLRPWRPSLAGFAGFLSVRIVLLTVVLIMVFSAGSMILGATAPIWGLAFVPEWRNNYDYSPISALAVFGLCQLFVYSVLCGAIYVTCWIICCLWYSYVGDNSVFEETPEGEMVRVASLLLPLLITAPMPGFTFWTLMRTGQWPESPLVFIPLPA